MGTEVKRVEDHYETLLASRYTWMMGGLDRCIEKANELLEFAGVPSRASGVTVLDLGSGPGYHARKLAERGFRVIAVDASESCLEELRTLCAGLAVVPVHGDLSDAALYEKYAPFSWAFCVGDTLTHLSSVEEVGHLLGRVAGLMAPGGMLVLEFREQPRDLIAQDAIITTRAERDRIMQCILHYEARRVWITDVVHEWTGTEWITRKSSYAKLRLSGDAIAKQAAEVGFALARNETVAGRRILVLTPNSSADTPS